ncbi:HPF/RaiA family ribosome-associated protein [Methylocella tundrae]|uniref:Cold-shock protein DNA-binding n=1 Tax=Methylocella tundrae TaxID=227605 RepID=A0A4U8Z4C0_METTU|nr:HPF/RaiA family ribosome-associated protein [Methylocella tundrae]WPP04095.1 HPF/RaiA family ribosome-associated protein [Methylocella tundrae]VFU10347.1 Cold-shock protein DNA-binding [Methylocella tundrae]
MDRPLQIVFRDIQHSEALAKLIEERVQRLEHIYAHIIGCRVVAGASHRGPRNTVAPLALCVEVEVPGRPLIVAKSEAKRKGQQNTLVHRVFDAVQRQLEQLAEIIKGNVKRHENGIESGVVVRLFPEQDHGFVEVKGGPDLYFSRSCVMRGSFDNLKIGAMVHFTRAAAEGVMGPQASAVYVLEQRETGRDKAARPAGALEPIVTGA